MRSPFNQMGGGQRGGLGQRMFSYFGAFIIAAYLAPFLFHFTISTVQSFVAAQYGFSGLLVDIIWGGTMGLITFGAAHIALNLLIAMLTVSSSDSF